MNNIKKINKKFNFKFLNVQFSISLMNVLMITVIYIIGLIIGSLMKFTLNEENFSPFLILNYYENNLSAFSHAFLYFFLFPTILFFFSNSKFGFCFVPLIFLIKGIFTAISITFLQSENFISMSVLMYALLITFELIVILIYGAYCMNISKIHLYLEKEYSYTFDVIIFIILFIFSIFSVQIQIII